MIEVLKNEISVDGMKTIRVMSNRALSDANLLKYVPGAAREWAKVTCETTTALSLFYGTVTYPLREVVEMRMQKAEGGRQNAEGRMQKAECRMQNVEGGMRKLAVWKLVPEEGYRVSEIIEFLAGWYFEKTHQRAGFAFMKKLPKDVESGEWELDGVTLFEAEWALSGCVMVGG